MYKGVLSAEDKQQAIWDGLLGAGAQMIAASGPRLTPGAPALGAGLTGFTQARNNSLNNSRDLAYDERQLERQSLADTRATDMYNRGIERDKVEAQRATTIYNQSQDKLKAQQAFTQSLPTSQQPLFAAYPELAMKNHMGQQDRRQKQSDAFALADYKHNNSIKLAGAKHSLDNSNPKPYAGNGMAAQNANILLTGDPSSAIYAAAYNSVAEPKTHYDPKTGSMYKVNPDMSAYRNPTFNQPLQPSSNTQEASLNPEGQQYGGSGGVEVEQVGLPNVPMNGDQSNAALYADRMFNSNEIITNLGKAGLSIADQALSQMPLGNHMISNEYQQLDQAKRDFINATLRRESGAAIAPSEFDNANAQYFPQPGDSPETIAQKAKNREIAIAGISRAAGPMYQSPRLTDSSASAPPVTNSPHGGSVGEMSDEEFDVYAKGLGWDYTK